MGHSLGSAISNTVLRLYPELVDAAILTGASYYGVVTAPSLQAKQLRVANLQSRAKWGKLDGGYAVWVDLFSNIEGYDALLLSSDNLN